MYSIFKKLIFCKTFTIIASTQGWHFVPDSLDCNYTVCPKSTGIHWYIFDGLRNLFSIPSKRIIISLMVFVGKESVSSHFEKGVKGGQLYFFNINPYLKTIIGMAYLPAR